jgi:hypothetical protein
MKIDIKLFDDAQKRRRQTLYELIFNKRLTISSLKKQLMVLLENVKERGIKRKIKNDLDFLNHQFEFRKRSSIKKKKLSQSGGLKFPRKWSKSYCKQTSCKKMGFSQRSSCRPYKNCYK